MNNLKNVLTAMLLLISLGLFAQAPSPFTQMQLASGNAVNVFGTPEPSSFFPGNPLFGGEVLMDLSPKDPANGEGISQDLVYNLKFGKNLFVSKDGRFGVTAVTGFNLDSFNIINIFDDAGISASAAPWALITAGDSPLVIHGAVKGNFDVQLAKPSILRAFAGLEQTVANMNKGLAGSVGVNAHFGNQRAQTEGVGWQVLASFPLSTTTSLIAVYENYQYTGIEKRTDTFKVGLAALGVLK